MGSFLYSASPVQFCCSRSQIYLKFECIFSCRYLLFDINWNIWSFSWFKLTLMHNLCVGVWGSGEGVMGGWRLCKRERQTESSELLVKQLVSQQAPNFLTEKFHVKREQVFWVGFAKTRTRFFSTKIWSRILTNTLITFHYPILIADHFCSEKGSLFKKFQFWPAY